MKKKFNSYLCTYLILLITIFVSELIFKAIDGSDIWNISTLRIFFSTNIIASIFTFLLSLVKRKGLRSFLTCLITFISSCYTAVQLGFKNFLGVYISFQTSSQLGAVTDYIGDFILSFKPLFFLTFIPFVISLIFIILSRKKIGDKIEKRLNVILSLMLLLTSVSLYMATIIMPLLQDKYQTISTRQLFKTASNPSLTVEQYGTVGFCFLDIKAMIFPVDETEEYNVNKAEEKEVNEYSRVIDDTLWKKAMEDEKNKTIKSLDSYFMSRDITDKNEFTGMFEGKNLIVIMMESVNDIMINPDYYPNFSKMVNEGWYWENNYSPRNSCATMNNEFSGMTSLYSIYNTCTASKYKGNKYHESLFNLFNNQGYVTFSAHDYTQSYYPRKTIHRNMGSGEYYGVEKLGIRYSNEYINWADDDDFMKKMLKIIDKKTSNGEHFMTWLTTVSSHQPYSSSSIQGDRYLNLTKGTGYYKDIRRFMSKLKILDNGFGVLLEGLESRGILDDTVIVLYGDHYPYGISTRHLNQVMDINNSVDYNAERVPFVIYNSQIEGKKYSEYTSYLNIVPTLANLFNVEYDPRLYLGHDVLSKDYSSLVVFADGSWKNEIAFYNASKNKIKYYGDKELTPEQIKNINDDINTKINVSSKVIKNNYFNNLDRRLNNEKSKIENDKVASVSFGESEENN